MLYSEDDTSLLPVLFEYRPSQTLQLAPHWSLRLQTFGLRSRTYAKNWF